VTTPIDFNSISRVRTITQGLGDQTSPPLAALTFDILKTTRAPANPKANTGKTPGCLRRTVRFPTGDGTAHHRSRPRSEKPCTPPPEPMKVSRGQAHVFCHKSVLWSVTESSQMFELVTSPIAYETPNLIEPSVSTF